MEAFPDEYVEHNLPLVFLSGLGHRSPDAKPSSGGPSLESGTRIHLASPECTDDRAERLRESFQDFDGSNQSWNISSLPGPTGTLGYKVKSIGRTFTLPPRKAAPMAQPTSSGANENRNGSPSGLKDLHSPLSPLSPSSPTHPDGLLTPQWLSRHQQHVPALVIGFFDFPSTHVNNVDEQIKADVNSVRSSLTRSGYRTKFAAILIGDRNITQDPAIEERLSAIRRATGLDSKQGLFYMPSMASQSEIDNFVQTVCKALQPLIIDVYRDLTKHARRKKARVGTSPVVSSATGEPPLSTSGWNIRYEVKQGVFAEFRQEMETAERHFTAALDDIFSAEGVLEFTPTWSRRWNEARLLADSLAIRVIRCHLWNSATSAAIQAWLHHRIRTRSLVDRRGKGLQTYAWAGWESRWAESMAQLVIRADLPIFQQKQKSQNEPEKVPDWQVYAPSEKTNAPAERVLPFHHLHHPGYWFKLAAVQSQLRRERALKIQKEDTISPGQSPASAVVKRSKSYDVYLVREPHEESPLSSSSTHDHLEETATLIDSAVQQFRSRNQSRMTEMLVLDMARNFMDAERFEEAMQILLPFQDEVSWREDGWHDLLSEMLLLLHQCAQHLSPSQVLPDTMYELICIRFTPPESLALDLAHIPHQFVSSEHRPIQFHFEDHQRLSPIAVSFAYESKTTSVGEPIACQLTLHSRMNERAAPLDLSNVTLSFDNGRKFKIVHSPNAQADDGSVHVDDFVELPENLSEAQADLTFQPNSKRLINFTLTFRDAGNVRLTRITTTIESEGFRIQHSFTDESLFKSDSVFVRTEAGTQQKYLTAAESNAVTVSPKPPKCEINVTGLKKRYYIGETICLGVDIVNGEEEAIDGSISCRVTGDTDTSLHLRWRGADDVQATPSELEHSSEASTRHHLPTLANGGSFQLNLMVRAPVDPLKTSIEVLADYTLSSDRNAAIQKTSTLEFAFVNPFETTFDFATVLHPDNWPSYFDPESGVSEEATTGIPQLWTLTAAVRSITTEPVVLHSAQLVIDGVNDDSHVTAHTQAKEQTTLKPGLDAAYIFELRTQKASLDDHRPTSLESTVELMWSRDVESDRVTTRIPVPRLTIPVSEPRVLCTLDSPDHSNGTARLIYHIENPSTHFLTFALSMEASEEFAFSGPKYQALSLAPLSRHQIVYQIVRPDTDGTESLEDRWVWPLFQVVDSYYQKSLRVLPGGPNVKLDEKQNIGVWLGAR